MQLSLIRTAQFFLALGSVVGLYTTGFWNLVAWHTPGVLGT
jgi:hypothetical protein